jgi:hypothetical protein
MRKFRIGIFGSRGSEVALAGRDCTRSGWRLTTRILWNFFFAFFKVFGVFQPNSGGKDAGE